LEQSLGTSHGLSAATITRLTEQWKDDARAFAARSLAEVDYVYVWVDGIVRHEAPHDRVGVEDLHRPGCRGSRVKLRAA
jgi:transposase-like protein